MRENEYKQFKVKTRWDGKELEWDCVCGDTFTSDGRFFCQKCPSCHGLLEPENPEVKKLVKETEKETTKKESSGQSVLDW